MDRTQSAVWRQVLAMGCQDYEIGVFNRPQGRMLIRALTVRELVRAISWLKAVNAQGADIFIRPQGSMGILLVDDLVLGTVRRLRQEGLGPAVVTRTSEDNHQAWIRLSRDPLPRDLATRAAKLVAARLGGDSGSADWRHFGRLAGFTNRKPERVDAVGRPPYVLVLEATGKLAASGQDLLQQARTSLLSSPARGGCVPASPGGPADPVRAYRQIVESLRTRYGSEFDPSRADWMAVQNLLKNGLAPEQVRQVMLEASPDLHQRKRGHLADYCERTVDKAVAACCRGER